MEDGQVYLRIKYISKYAVEVTDIRHNYSLGIIITSSLNLIVHRTLQMNKSTCSW